MYFVFIKPRMHILGIKSRVKRVRTLDILWKAVLLLQEGSQKYVWVFDATVFYLTLKDRLIDVLFCKLLHHSWLSHYSLGGRKSTPEYVTPPRKELPCTLGKSSFYFLSTRSPPIFSSTTASLVHSVCSLPHRLLLCSISESEQQIPPLSFSLAPSSVGSAWAPITVLPQNVVMSVTCLMEVLK